MDYDQFAQMVLGANIKKMPQGKLTSMFDPKQGGNKMNPHANLANIINANYQDLAYNEEVVKATLAMTQDEDLNIPSNQEEFDMFVTRKCSDSMQRYTYMRLIDLAHYANIFKREFSSELFILLVKTFTEQVIKNENFNNETEQEFIVQILSLISKTTGFDFVLSFLEEKDLEISKALVF